MEEKQETTQIAQQPEEEKKKTQRTKIVGYLMIGAAVLNTVVDALNGGGFDAGTHLNDLYVALGGAGFVFAREAIAKVERQIKGV